MVQVMDLKELWPEDIKRLAFLTATKKALEPALAAVRDDVREPLFQRFQADRDNNKQDILYGSEKVGTAVVWCKGGRVSIKPGCEDDAIVALRALGLVNEIPARGWDKRFGEFDGSIISLDTGEVVDWACWEPREPKSLAVLGCKPDTVIELAKPRLETVSALDFLQAL